MGVHAGNDPNGGRPAAQPPSAQAALPATAAAQPAVLILKNANVITVNSRSSIAEAMAVAVDKILAVGPDASVAAHAGPARASSTTGKRSVSPA